jgi:hypothetical protein
MGKSIFTLVLLIISLLVVIKIKNFIKNNSEGPIVAPVVSPIPTPTPTSDIETIVNLSLNEVAIVKGVSISFAAVTEDSRCPSDVQCIQAGIVKVSVQTIDGMGTSTMEIKPGDTITTETLSITLLEVSPYPISTQRILPEDYRFRVSIKDK